MRAHLIPLLIFLILSCNILYATTHTSFSKISTPFSFLAHLASPLRASMYSSAHAADKTPTELDRVKNENSKLISQMVSYNNLKKDNVALRSQFQDTSITSEKLVPAHIVGFKGAISSPDTFVVDIGSNSHVKTGMAVILGNSLVGQVSKVTQYFSEIILVTNKNFSTLALTSAGNSPGIITGEDDFILFDHVVITDTISQKDTVVSKGGQNINGIGIPANLIIGKIMSVHKSETSPFQSAIVKSLLNFSKINMVFVVTNDN